MWWWKEEKGRYVYTSSMSYIYIDHNTCWWNDEIQFKTPSKSSDWFKVPKCKYFITVQYFCGSICTLLKNLYLSKSVLLHHYKSKAAHSLLWSWKCLSTAALVTFSINNQWGNNLFRSKTQSCGEWHGFHSNCDVFCMHLHLVFFRWLENIWIQIIFYFNLGPLKTNLGENDLLRVKWKC